VLTKDIAPRVSVPHEPGTWVALRKLPWTQLARAASVGFVARGGVLMAFLLTLGGAVTRI
jgi:hypothetical protein